jgi:hypothetical protein
MSQDIVPTKRGGPWAWSGTSSKRSSETAEAIARWLCLNGDPTLVPSPASRAISGVTAGVGKRWGEQRPF